MYFRQPGNPRTLGQRVDHFQAGVVTVKKAELLFAKALTPALLVGRTDMSLWDLIGAAKLNIFVFHMLISIVLNYHLGRNTKPILLFWRVGKDRTIPPHCVTDVEKTFSQPDGMELFCPGFSQGLVTPNFNICESCRLTIHRKVLQCSVLVLSA